MLGGACHVMIMCLKMLKSDSEQGEEGPSLAKKELL